MKKENILFMEKGNGASLPEFIETQGVLDSREVVYSAHKAVIFQNNISGMSVTGSQSMV